MGFWKSFGKILWKARSAFFIALSAVFLGLIIAGFGDLFPNIENPIYMIVIGFVGLLVFSWLGIGPLSKK